MHLAAESETGSLTSTPKEEAFDVAERTANEAIKDFIVVY
jgi:hypothetical protein